MAMSDEEQVDESKGETSAATASPDKRGAGTSREMSLTTLVHIMGLPTATQLSLLESKIDLLTSKVGQMMLKLDRMATDLSMMKSDATVDRIDFQLTDIRALLKRVVPAGVIGGEVETKVESASKPKSSKAKILTSEPAAGGKEETKIVEQDQLSEFNETADDAAYQAAEGNRVRMQTK